MLVHSPYPCSLQAVVKPDLIMKTIMKLKPLSGVALIFLLIMLSMRAVFAQQTNIPLREGVVIDKARNAIYLLSPNTKLQAVSIASGEILWTSTDSLKPLALVNGQLLAQAINTSNELVITQIDVTQKGRQLNRNSVTLPLNTKADFRPSGNHAFKTYSRVVDGQPYILWEFHQIPLRGMPDEDSVGKDIGALSQSGIIRVETTTGRLSTADKATLPQSQLNKSIKLDNSQGIANNAEQQFLSTDENHILTSRRVAGNEEFNNYIWEIFLRSSRTKLGDLRDYRSFAPFYVTGTTIIYEIGPYSRVVNGEVVEVPLQLIAVDLSNGRELWRRPIFDTINRLSPPPGMKQR